MKRTTRRLTLSTTTITELDPRRLPPANGGFAETGCVGGCNSAFPCFDFAKKAE